MKLSTAALAAGVALVVAKLVEFTKASIETGLQFDKSMSQIAATMGTTVDQVSGLRDEAQRLGATTAYSAQEAAEGMNILAQSGLKEQEIIAALPDVLNLAAAGNLDLATSASYVTGAFKGFGDTAENAAKYTDLIAVGASKSNTTV
jgi:TP901 family phage tail tape measure protein